MTHTKIGIIGGGISGTSCALYIKDAIAKYLCPEGQSCAHLQNLSITLFERGPGTGGRNQSVHLSDKEDQDVSEVELGGSHIIKDNRYATDLVERFGLTLVERHKSIKPVIAVWDWESHEVLFRTWPSSMRTFLSMMYRYELGFPILGARNEIANAISKFVKIYDMQQTMTLAECFTFRTIQQFLDAVDMLPLSRLTFHEHMVRDRRIQEQFVREVLEPVLRINYMQGARQLSALAGMIGSAGFIRPFCAIKQGTHSLSRSMARDSQSSLKLNREVVHISHNDKTGQYELKWRNSTSHAEEGAEFFDIVVIATPLEQSNIVFGDTLSARMPMGTIQRQRPFIKGITTVVVADNINPSVFNLPSLPSDNVWYVMTAEPERTDPVNLPFNVVGFAGTTHQFSHDGHLVFKLFSHKKISDSMVKSLFPGVQMITSHRWDRPGSYPILSPSVSPSEEWPPVVLDNHLLYYTSSMESVVSTMETSLISSMNIALLITKELAAQGIANEKSEH